MEIKLEITGATLTPEQREAIQQKLEEIKAIAKNKETKAESPASRTIKKWLEKWDKKAPTLARNKRQSIELEKGQVSLLCELLKNELDKRPNFHRRFHLSELLHRIEEQMFSAPQYVKSKENYLAQSPQKHSKHNNNRQSERVQKILLLKVPTEISPQEIEDVLKQILGKTYSHHHGPQV